MTFIEKLLSEIPSAQQREAQRYLDSGQVVSIKYLPDKLDPCIEGIMQESDTLLIPHLLLNEGVLSCQCTKSENLCVHKAALLLAAHTMQKANHPDYHMATKILTAQQLEHALHLK